MPTIKDIAREAGVSHGTVSNVLNGRGNVSVEKIRLVRQAAEQLGYRINEKAQVLRKGSTQTVALLVPGMIGEQYAMLYEVLEQELTVRGYTLHLYATQGIDVVEKAMLCEALATQVCAIIVDSCLSDAALFYQNETDGTPVFFLQQTQAPYPGSCGVSFDYRLAGDEIGRYLKEHGAHSVGLFLGEESSYAIQQLLSGLRATLYRDEIILRTVCCSDHQLDIDAFELFEDNAAYDYLVCSDRQRMQAAQVAHTYASLTPAPKYVVLSPHRAISDIKHANYELDYKRMAHQICKTLLAHLEEHEPLPASLPMQNTGFPAVYRCDVSNAEELQMLTVASPASVALNRLLPYLERSAGIRLRQTVMSLNDIYELLQRSEESSRYDLIRMDMAWLDELGPRIYFPLDQLAFDWDALFRRFHPIFGEHYSRVCDERLCLPYDPSTQILFYRKDIFENPIYKRMYYETTRKELRVPRTFTEYNEIAAFFTQSHNPFSPLKYGSTAAIGSATVSTSEYLVRLYGSGSDLLDADGRISINTPAARDALENYAQTYECSDKTQYQWWKNALQSFAEGSVAMTVVFMNHASDILNLKRSNIAGKIGFAPVPGGKPLIGGGVIGMTRTSQKHEAATRFLDWLYTAPVASTFTTLGGLSPCRSVYEDRGVYEKYPWLSAAKQSFPIGKLRGHSTFYHNFSQYQLEKRLSFEIKSAILGTATVGDALSRAQCACEQFFSST